MIVFFFQVYGTPGMLCYHQLFLPFGKNFHSNGLHGDKI
jgi:hypothetical protein